MRFVDLRTHDRRITDADPWSNEYAAETDMMRRRTSLGGTVNAEMGSQETQDHRYVVLLSDISSADIGLVGGKNASLGEMIRHLTSVGIAVPPGFATTASAYWAFIEGGELTQKLRAKLADLSQDRISLVKAGKAIRRWMRETELPDALAHDICQHYRQLCDHVGTPNLAVAVRSSATAEDLPEASFAGQQESFLNIRGEDQLLATCRRCFASLFTDRAITYRERHGFDHMQVALSIGVQQMVRSDQAGAGVMFTIDTETGFSRVIIIDANWGLGESVVQGMVDPDHYVVFKPLLHDKRFTPIISNVLGAKERKIVYATHGRHTTRTVETSMEERCQRVLEDEEIMMLARWGQAIEEHYGCPMDIEWAKDGDSDDIFIVQARPETVQSRRGAQSLKTYNVTPKGKRLVSGLSIGDAAATGTVRRLDRPTDAGKLAPGDVLVATMTDPDWLPAMKRSVAIVTDHGGRTSHAAIVSRELGIPAVIGTKNATKILKTGRPITVSCAEGTEGHVYDGVADIEVHDIDLADIAHTKTQVMINVADPSAALRWWQLPTDGVGLARIEFIITSLIGIHPLALTRFDNIEDTKVRTTIRERTSAYSNPPEFFVDVLAQGIARIAASQYPKPVIVRTSDFKSNEYASLLGGSQFEPVEENPMLGWRGASRYYSHDYRDGFALECRAIRRARSEYGFDNIAVMIPFCRTPDEADRTLEAMAANNLVRGRDGLQVYVMCEIPSNVILAHEFARQFDGFSIGSNDLTQLTLGVDRDSARLAPLFNEDNDAVKTLIRNVITTAHEYDTPVGFCGQAPSDEPTFARFLVAAGIDSISVTPDSFLKVKEHVAAAEAQTRLGRPAFTSSISAKSGTTHDSRGATSKAQTR